MSSITSDITRECIKYIYNEFQKKSNKKRISYVIDTITHIAIERMQPYLYAIMAILLIMFLFNCLQFYYYLRYIIRHAKNEKLEMISIEQ